MSNITEQLAAALRSLLCQSAVDTDDDDEIDQAVVQEARDALAAHDAEQQGDAYMVLQEGGSSEEMYVHSSDSMDAAEEFRISCKEAAYRTSAVIVVPAALAAHGEELYELVETVARADMSYPGEEDAP